LEGSNFILDPKQ